MQLTHEYGNDSGIPFPQWTFVTVPAADSPSVEIRRRGVRVAEGKTWEEASDALLSDFRNRPGEYFELEEAMQWLDNARRSNESSFALLAKELVADTERTKAFYQTLRRLVIRRVPIRDTRTIINCILTSSTQFFDIKAGAQRSLIDEIRARLTEGSAAFLCRYFWRDEDSLFAVVVNQGDFHKRLEPVRSNADKMLGVALIESLIHDRKVRGLLILVLESGALFGSSVSVAMLSEQCDELLRAKKISCPVILLTSGEAAAPSFETLPKVNV